MFSNSLCVQDVPPENIPTAKTADGLVEVKVIAGESLGMHATSEHHMALDSVLAGADFRCAVVCS